MEILKKMLENGWIARIVSSIVIIIISVIAYKSVIYLLNKGEEKSKIKVFTSNKGKTYFKLVKSIIRSVFLVLTILIILQVNGINVSSVLAGVGIFGVIFGLAIQDWLKDIIRGSRIISDDYFTVGDIVKYKDMEGKVLVIELKTTKIKNIRTGNVVSIANRNIDEVEVVSYLVHVKIPMPYEVKVLKAEKAVDDIIDLIKKNEFVDSCKYMGVTELEDSCIEYLLEIECNVEKRLQVRRDTLRDILVGLEKNGIEVPYNQIDVHNK